MRRRGGYNKSSGKGRSNESWGKTRGLYTQKHTPHPTGIVYKSGRLYVMTKGMSERTIGEMVGNNLLLLFLVDETSKEGKVEGDLKAQKLVFLSQKLMVQRKLKAFNYNFFRWHKGPYCADLSNDLKRLKVAGLVRRNGSRLELTDLGKSVIANCEAELTDWTDFISPIREVAQEYGRFTPEELKERVYDIAVFVPRDHKVMKIRDIEEKKLILFKPSEKEARKVLSLSENWQATLELVFSKEAQDSLRMAQRDAVEGRICDFHSL